MIPAFWFSPLGVFPFATVVPPVVVVPPGQGTVVNPPLSATPDRYSSADLLLMCREKAGRPAIDAQMPDASWYRLLTEAQDMFLPEIASRVPTALSGQYAVLNTDDGGLTYNFGLDPYGEPVTALGHVDVWARSGGVTLMASSYGAHNGGFVIEQTGIRSPGGVARTYDAGPFARWVGIPPAITATVQPIIQPRPMRVLLVWLAVMLWSERGARRDPMPWREGFRREWLGDPSVGLLGWCAHLQLRFTTANVSANPLREIGWWQDQALSLR